MRVTVVGTGYVGLVSAACLADVGNDVLCVDLDEAKIETLRRGRMPIYEPGLEQVVKRNAEVGRIKFTTDIERSVQFGSVQFLAVGTPPDEDGAADLRHVLAAASSIGRYMTEHKIVVDKSTVPVGTGDRVEAAIAQELRHRGLDVSYAVVANPEFLKEGAAIEDFMRPDRIVVGSGDSRATDVMRALYAPFNRNHDKMIVMDRRSAELTKYAANAMLATRISFMNELANLAERLGADIEMVRQGIGSDPRIGYQFLYPGCGYGGSCFPKDVQALIRAAHQDADLPLRVLSAVEAANEVQKLVLVDKVKRHFGADLKGRRFALWGLAFKPNTDDMREAPSRSIIAGLLAAGARVVAYDPVAMLEAKRVFGTEPRIEFAETALAALDGADALLIATEWKEFRSPDFDAIVAALARPVIFDGRNLYSPRQLRERGIDYFPIGR